LHPPVPNETVGVEARLAASPAQSATSIAAFNVPWYIITMVNESQILVERVQTGVRMEKRLLKVLKALAEYHDMSLGDLLEGIVLHAFDGKSPFSSSSLKRIHDLKKFYALDLDSSASHRLTEIKRRSGNKTVSEKKK
jgi:predicted DNA-binding ribbon-helix-helix protein